MIPGGPRNQRQMELMMRRMGMRSESIDDVEEVVVRTRTQEHVFERPDVTILTVQGITTYQVVGAPVVRPRGTGPAAAAAPAASTAPAGPPDEDIQLVMDQAQVDRPTAIEALFRAHGAPAEAIMQLLTRGK
ncbi:nascent polypeptide-associated complex protein [mine drainage metagenome]|uniref:Nascent polypeptide-associated complex protein n=1 Tax=mine drainage metagenome TaxID=410659 RepID=T1BEH7_9ZZZZ